MGISLTPAALCDVYVAIQVRGSDRCSEWADWGVWCSRVFCRRRLPPTTVVPPSAALRALCGADK
jgi:hypothetical protein